MHLHHNNLYFRHFYFPTLFVLCFKVAGAKFLQWTTLTVPDKVVKMWCNFQRLLGLAQWLMCKWQTGEIKETVPGIRADLNVAGSLFHSGTAIRADLCDWELAVNVDGSFARWWIIVAINNMTLVSPFIIRFFFSVLMVSSCPCPCIHY